MKGGNGATNGSAVTLPLEPLSASAAETAAIRTQQSLSFYYIILSYKIKRSTLASITNSVG